LNIFLDSEVDRNAVYYVLPVAFDLDRNGSGEVICGRETAAACVGAVEVAISIESSRGHSEIIVTAGRVANGWNVVMADVMAKYIAALLKLEQKSDVKTIVSPAPTFNTEGELRQLLTCIGEHTMKLRPEIVVVVKNWHALRVWVLLKLMGWEASRVGRYMPNWTIVKIPSKVPYRHRMREFIAIPENFFRIVWKNLRSRR
jgi:hypothetical protein